LKTLAQTLLQTGQADEFRRRARRGESRAEARRRLQLKTLLFGHGRDLRTLLQRKVGEREGRIGRERRLKRPRNIGACCENLSFAAVRGDYLPFFFGAAFFFAAFLVAFFIGGFSLDIKICNRKDRSVIHI